MASWLEASLHIHKLLPPSLIHPLAREYIQTHFASGFAIACSGGVDSVALALWAASCPLFKKSQLAILHYNHNTRGKASDADLLFVQDLALALGLPFFSSKNPIKVEASEHALREARYTFLHQTMEHLGLQHLLLGHQLEDIAETMLMRLSRGSGLSGLAVPRPVQKIGQNITHLRPFLTISKNFLKELLKGYSWQEDASNKNLIYLRNAIRHTVLPCWQKVTKNNDLLSAVAHSRDLLEEEDSALNTWLSSIIPPLQKELSRNTLKSLPKAIWRRAVHQFLQNNNLSSHLCAQGFQQLLDGFYDGSLKRISIGPCWLELKQEELVIIHCKAPIAYSPIVLMEGITLFFPDNFCLKVELIDLKKTLLAKIVSDCIQNPNTAYVDASNALYVRPWKPGDAYCPIGLSGRKKLQDMFTDKKIPPSIRHTLPILINSELDPIWAPGLNMAKSHAISPQTLYALKLTYQKIF